MGVMIFRERLPPRKGLKRRPFLGLHPGFAVPPSVSSQSELPGRHAHSLGIAVSSAVADGWGALALSIGKAPSIVVTEPIQLRSDFTRLRALPPDTLTSSHYFRHSNQHLWVTGSAVEPLAGLPSSHSFQGEVSSSGRLPLSIPLVQLCSAHTPKSRRARFRALPLRSPPGIDSASLRSFPRQL